MVQSMRGAAQWLQNRQNQIAVAANAAFWEELKKTLPASSRQVQPVVVSAEGVTGEISHGLTSEGVANAMKASNLIQKKGWEEMLKDFQQEFLGPVQGQSD